AGGHNPSEPYCQICHLDPVNTVTGEFYETVTDLDAGGGLVFPRSYGSSLATFDSGLGRGFSTDVGMHLEIAADATGTTLADASQLVVVQENGSFVPFARLEGELVSFDRVNAMLSEQPDGSYVFERTDGIRYAFSADGLLTST